jgi:hypothetical protein
MVTMTEKPRRMPGILHRSAIVAADKCTLPTLATKSTAATGGTLVKSTTYYIAVAPGTLFGSAGACNVLSQATAADNPQTHSITLTIPQVLNAEHYDIFMSGDAAPKWVGRITELQRAAGGFQIQTYGVVTSGGANAAGTVLLGCVGTGIQTTNATFAANNAYTIPTPTGVVYCTAKNYLDIFVELTVTDLRSAIILKLMPMFKSKESKWYCGSPITVYIMQGAVGQSKRQTFRLDVKDMTECIIAIGSISGQGASCNIWVEAV